MPNYFGGMHFRGLTATSPPLPTFLPPPNSSLSSYPSLPFNLLPPPPSQVEQAAVVDEATGTARVRSAHNGVMRWRKRTLPDGQEVTESNARFVRWSDGSLQVRGGGRSQGNGRGGGSVTHLLQSALSCCVNS